MRAVACRELRAVICFISAWVQHRSQRLTVPYCVVCAKRDVAAARAATAGARSAAGAMRATIRASRTDGRNAEAAAARADGRDAEPAAARCTSSTWANA